MLTTLMAFETCAPRSLLCVCGRAFACCYVLTSSRTGEASIAERQGRRA